MKRAQIVNDIFNDIEFEIAQGIVSEGELGEGIEEVRSFQNKARIETFDLIKVTDRYRKVLGQIYQINDMQTTLMYEIALHLQSMQLQIQKITGKPELFLPITAQSFPEVSELSSPLSNEYTKIDERIASIPTAEDVRDVVKPEALQLEMKAVPVRIPIIGNLLTKLKIFFQKPALFYSRNLASQQLPINQVLGEHILQLERIIHNQQQQLDEPNARLNQQQD